MSEYDLEIPADQIFHWLKEELASGRERIAYRCSREFVADEASVGQVGESSEDTGVHAVSTTATLEVFPIAPADGWMLKVFVEDVVGPHVPENGSAPSGAEDIQLDDFYAQFIAPDSGTVFVTVSADTETAKSQFEGVLSEMTEDRHIA